MWGAPRSLRLFGKRRSSGLGVQASPLGGNNKNRGARAPRNRLASVGARKLGVRATNTPTPACRPGKGDFRGHLRRLPNDLGGKILGGGGGETETKTKRGEARTPRKKILGVQAWGGDGGVTDTGVLVRKRGLKGGSLVCYSGEIIHHNPRWYLACLGILHLFGTDGFLGSPQIL